MLEQKLEELNATIRELIVALKSGGTPQTAAPKPETPAPKPEAPAAKPAEEKKTSKGDPAVLKQIQEKGMSLIKAQRQEEVKKILKDAGAATFTALKGDKYAEVLDALSTLETTAPAVAAPVLDYEKDVKPTAKLVVEAGEASVAEFKKLLAKYKVAKGQEVPVAQLPAFLEDIKKLLPKQEDALV